MNYRIVGWYAAMTAALVFTTGQICAQERNGEAISGAAGETRLPYINDKTVYPPAINGQPITVYRDPSDNRQRRYIKPYFMPSWESFHGKVLEACNGADGSAARTVPIQVEFASKRVNEEIAEQLKADDPTMSLSNLFSYPVYALFVVSGASDPSDAVPTTIQFRYPPGVSEALPRGVVAAVDFPLTSLGFNPPLRVRDTCDNLTMIYDARDLNAFIYTQYAEVKLNASSAIASAFVESRAFTDLDREESASGVIRVTTRSGSTGIGFNLGGFLGGQKSDSSSSQTADDTRRRAVSASLAQNAAEEGMYSGVIFQRFEAADLLTPTAIVDTLLNFILGEATTVKARVEKREGGQLAIVADTYARTLSQEETKVLLESAPVQELNLSSKEQMDCNMLKAAATAGAGGAGAATDAAQVAAPAAGGSGSGKQCGSERAMTSKYSDTIKWQRDGPNWIPTEVDLYSVSTQTLKQRAVLGVETAIVQASTQAQIHTLKHITDGEPTNYVIDLMDARINGVIAKIDGPAKQIIPIAGGIYKTIGYWSGGGNQNVFDCIATPGSPGEGFELVGANDVTTYDSRQNIFSPNLVKALGCRGADHCDSAGEFCVSYERAPGCYVNSAWTAWYREVVQRKGESPRNDEICAPPL